VQAPARLAGGVVDAVRSLAPSATAVVATGYGARVALHAARRRPAAVRAVVVIDGGPIVSGVGPFTDEERFEEPAAAVARVAAQAPHRSQSFNRHLVAETTVVGDDGRWRWRSQLRRPVPEDRPPGDDVGDLLDALTVPVLVISAATHAPLDPVAALVAAKWPARVRRITASSASDLLGSSPLATAAAIAAALDEFKEGAE